MLHLPDDVLSHIACRVDRASALARLGATNSVLRDLVRARLQQRWYSFCKRDHPVFLARAAHDARDDWYQVYRGHVSCTPHVMGYYSLVPKGPAPPLCGVWVTAVVVDTFAERCVMHGQCTLAPDMRLPWERRGSWDNAGGAARDYEVRVYANVGNEPLFICSAICCGNFAYTTESDNAFINLVVTTPFTPTSDALGLAILGLHKL